MNHIQTTGGKDAAPSVINEDWHSAHTWKTHEWPHHLTKRGSSNHLMARYTRYNINVIKFVSYLRRSGVSSRNSDFLYQ